MPLNIEYDVDLPAFDRGVEAFMQDVWREACKLAVDEACRQIRIRLSEKTRQVFDRPVQFTIDAFGQWYANSRDPDPEGKVFVYAQQAKYLANEIFGGEREAGDYATTRGGPLIPIGTANLDAYGNLPRKFISEAIRRGAFWLHPKAHPDRAVLADHLAEGGIEFLAEIIPRAIYAERRLAFYDIVEEGAAALLPRLPPYFLGFLLA